MADVGFIYRVTGEPAQQGWYHVHPHPLRKIPAGQGMGTFCQQVLGWQLKVLEPSARDELLENFGQGPDFT